MPYAIKLFFVALLGGWFLAAPVQAADSASQHFTVGQKMSGLSAWYGQRAHGNRTASGKTFDSTQLTAAHRTLPFGTMVKVTNKKNNKSVVVKVTDRGPADKKFIIDISKKAAIDIGMLKQGVAPVTLQIVSLPSSSSKKTAKK